MAITKNSAIDQVIVHPETGLVQWRETTIVEENGVILAKSYARGSCEIDADATGVPAVAIQVRRLFDTPAVRAKAAKDRADALKKLKP